MVEINAAGNQIIMQGIMKHLTEQLEKASVSGKSFCVIVEKDDESGFINAVQGDVIHLCCFMESAFIEVLKKAENENGKAVSDALYMSFMEKLRCDYKKISNKPS